MVADLGAKRYTVLQVENIGEFFGLYLERESGKRGRIITV